MIVISIKPSEALREIMQGSFPTVLLGISSIPVLSLEDSSSEAIRCGQYDIADIIESGTTILKRLCAVILPFKDATINYQKMMQKKYENSKDVVAKDLFFQVSLEYIYAKDGVENESMNSDESIFQYYSITIGENTRRRDNLLYKLDSRFFDTIENVAISDKIDTGNKYLGEFFVSLADIFAYRDILFFRQGGGTESFVEVGEQRYREEYLSPSEKELIYG